jgi:hypothetical protein
MGQDTAYQQASVEGKVQMVHTKVYCVEELTYVCRLCKTYALGKSMSGGLYTGIGKVIDQNYQLITYYQQLAISID